MLSLTVHKRKHILASKHSSTQQIEAVKPKGPLGRNNELSAKQRKTTPLLSGRDFSLIYSVIFYLIEKYANCSESSLYLEKERQILMFLFFFLLLVSYQVYFVNFNRNS